MDGKSIVLNLISCKGVKCFTLFQKLSVYVVVSVAGGGDGRKPKQLKHKTSADHEGGENLEWDQTLQFDLDCRDFQDRFLEFRFKAHGNVLLGYKLIGKSRVLMADLIEGQPSGVVRHVSYQVQSPDGKPNGVLSFSYRLNLPDMEVPTPPPLDRAIPSAPLCDDYPLCLRQIILSRFLLQHLEKVSTRLFLCLNLRRRMAFFIPISKHR